MATLATPIWYGLQDGRYNYLFVESIRTRVTFWSDHGGPLKIFEDRYRQVRTRLIDDMDVPGYRLHSLKGRARNRWWVWVSGNWRLTFEFRDGIAYVLDYEDYH